MNFRKGNQNPERPPFSLDKLKAVPYLETEHWWEWQIPLYLFLGGIAAGVMVLAAARVLVDPNDERSRTFRLLTWLSPLLLSLGMFALWLDLEKRWQVYRFYMAVRPLAPMSCGAWILLAVHCTKAIYVEYDKVVLLTAGVNGDGRQVLSEGISKYVYCSTLVLRHEKCVGTFDVPYFRRFVHRYVRFFWNGMATIPKCLPK